MLCFRKWPSGMAFLPMNHGVYFELGLIRIVTSDGRMGAEPCAGRDRAERIAQAQENRPLVELKRQMDRAVEKAS